MLTVLKLGGELLEDEGAVRSAARAIVRLAHRGPLVVVHGGGRAVDAELRARGLEPRFVDGLRITDADALDSVVAVLAGRTNTTLAAAIVAAGGRAVGLTGVDDGIGLSAPAEAVRSARGELVDLGLVGTPTAGRAALVSDLVRMGYIPVIASIGVTDDGALLNVNADTFAAHLAAVLRAGRLIVVGATAGVLDADGSTIQTLPLAAIDRMTASGLAHSGMIAKLQACRHALLSGVGEVLVVSGRAVEDFESATGTRIQRELVGA